jgi:hypothetical protein
MFTIMEPAAFPATVAAIMSAPTQVGVCSCIVM